MKILKQFFFFLSPMERRRAILILFLAIIMSILDMIGVASILPFIAVLTNPDLIETNIILKTMFQYFSIIGIKKNEEFLFALGILFFFILVFTLTFKALTQFVQVRFGKMREYSIGKRIIEDYLKQEYSWFLDRHSADIGKAILSEVVLIGNGLQSLIELISRLITVIAILTLLFIINVNLTLVIGLIFSVAYSIVYKLSGSRLHRIGKERLKSQEQRFITISEAFGAAKEVKVGGLEKNYIKQFSNSSKTYALNETSVTVISDLPRYAIEAMAFGGMILIILYLMNQTGNTNSVLPMMSVYAFAGYRLMPCFQQIYHSLVTIKFVAPSLDKLYHDVKTLKPGNLDQEYNVINFNKTIALKNVHYSYPNVSRSVLKDLNLTIHEKTTVGLVGETGSGKTTIVDIILGLLESQKGTLEVDGKIITKQNSRSWQKLIGYVPQHIYLSDDTIAANIAFGVDKIKINQDRIIRAAKIANLHKFVVKDLPNRYNTTIGERGVRLSGGQRQRIGIARALYNNPRVLVFDEATSALDNETEKAVMDAVNNIGKSITIILIAHRLDAIKFCDIIYKLDKGKIVKQGTYDEIFST